MKTPGTRNADQGRIARRQSFQSLYSRLTRSFPALRVPPSMEIRMPLPTASHAPRLLLLPDIHDTDGEACLALSMPAPRGARLVVFRSRPAALAALRAAEAAQ